MSEQQNKSNAYQLLVGRMNDLRKKEIIGGADELPTDKTLTGEHFAAVMSQWPNGEDHLAFIAETALRGDGSEFAHFGTGYAVEGDQLVATFHDGDIRRTDAAEFLRAIEQNYPEQLEKAKKDIAAEQFAAQALELRTTIVDELREQGEGSQYRVEGGVYSIEGSALVLRDEQGDVSGRWLVNSVTWELTAEQAAAPEVEMSDLLAEDIFPELADDLPTNASEAAREAYQHWMTLENTPEEFYRGERPEDMGEPMSYYDDETLDSMAAYERERVVDAIRDGVSGMTDDVGGNYELVGDTLLLRHQDGTVSAWKTDDLATELPPEQTRSLPVSDAVLDEVFEKHADPHMRSVHGLDERATPALSSEQVAQLVVQPSEDEKITKHVNEFANGFPSSSLADDLVELNANLTAASVYWAENSPHPTPMESLSEDQVDYRSAVESNRVLRFAAMADRAEAAARDANAGRTLETTNEQGA